MEKLISSFTSHWLLIGELNSIASSFDKWGGSSFGAKSSRCFQNFVLSVGAIDLGFSGLKYTWSNKRVGWANIRERLDRGICNANWQRLFPKAAVRHLTALCENHDL